MKNYYKVLGVNQNDSSEVIKDKTIENIKKIEKSNISQNEKKDILKKFEEAYKGLSDYHTRRKLDEYLSDNNHINVFNSPFFSSSFNFNDIIKNVENEFEKLNNTSKYYYSSSFTSNKYDKDGNITTESKIITNNNGEVKGKHIVKEKDKEGNDTVREIPLKINKKLLK